MACVLNTLAFQVMRVVYVLDAHFERTGESLVRNVTTKHAGAGLSPSIEDLRALVDARLQQNGMGTRAKALRHVDMAASSFERLLREGLTDRSPRAHERKLRELGVLDLIPRR